jgi:hypothetical protein
LLRELSAPLSDDDDDDVQLGGMSDANRSSWALSSSAISSGALGQRLPVTVKYLRSK